MAEPPTFLPIRSGHVQRWSEGDLATCHRFDQRTIDAVDAAIAAGRPLLVRGEPGTGKSQVAAAVARVLERPLVKAVIDARTEARDLQWRFDAVARLARAQVVALLQRRADQEVDVDALLAEHRFLLPGPLWWAFDWQGCVDRKFEPPCEVPQDWRPGQGVVVLLDEIDKADADVPNGMLEVLGAFRFRPQGGGEVRATGVRPFIVVTTNEERALPDAFLRRCLVLRLDFPSEAELLERSGHHFAGLDESVRKKAVSLLLRDRALADTDGLPKPGQAELFDLLRSVGGIGRTPQEMDLLIDRLAEFTYQKHPRE